MREKARHIFGDLHTDINLDTTIKSLGMAQKQMVEIAKALTFDANIMIFDEPTASLTEREVQALFSIIRQLKEKGLGIVYISHRLEEIFEICDRVTVIRDGQYISTKNVKDTNKDELVADMVGRKMGNYYPKTDTFIGEKIFEVRNYYDEGFLNDINFFVRKGEILGFAGLAGAGRTELMESICGLKGKAAGFVYLNGTELHIHNYEEAMEQGIVYVSEDRGGNYCHSFFQLLHMQNGCGFAKGNFIFPIPEKHADSFCGGRGFDSAYRLLSYICNKANYESHICADWKNGRYRYFQYLRTG